MASRSVSGRAITAMNANSIRQRMREVKTDPIVQGLGVTKLGPDPT
ncbi:hypothetical protein EDD27_9309 [Nonomuraea polychroma]|uniref:Uncharacterized protein n=1 Tax=Nonomuraea polychroma TaxID=46176 RepID=A0A438ML08_9ACTN|nr:hypothetical protein EDD27_9309 [Nonomuraea polychroma]